MKKWLFAWLPVAIWALIIFLLSSMPTIPTPFVIGWDFVAKKTAHVTEYGILAMLVYRALKRTVTTDISRLLVLTAGLCLVYAISDEVHQGFTPGRTPTVMDVGFDTIGIILGTLFSRRWQG